MSVPGLGEPKWRPSHERPRGAYEARCGGKTTGRSRRLADDGRRFTDPAVRFAGIVVGIVNAALVVISASRNRTGQLSAHLGSDLEENIWSKPCQSRQRNRPRSE